MPSHHQSAVNETFGRGLIQEGEVGIHRPAEGGDGAVSQREVGRAAADRGRLVNCWHERPAAIRWVEQHLLHCLVRQNGACAARVRA